MARQNLATEVNNFIGGFVTEASPLTFPQNTAIDITNFELSKTGLVSRRLGMDFEGGHELISLADQGISPEELAYGSHTWNNAGGDSSIQISVVQVGKALIFFRTDAVNLSSGYEQVYFIDSDPKLQYQSAVVDGLLVIASGSEVLSAFDYDETQPAGSRVSVSTYRLKIRDVFGVEFLYQPSDSTINIIDLREPQHVSLRPVTGLHVGEDPIAHYNYNLRNGVYSTPRLPFEGENREDPIEIFKSVLGQFAGLYSPSMSDSLLSSLYPDPEATVDKISDRFDAKRLYFNAIGSQEMPKGHFIIDALDRGSSRLEAVQAMEVENSYTNNLVDTLPVDRTEGGAKVVQEFAGRVWYAGFSGEVIGGDKYSPKMSSYILFSKLVDSPSELGYCHRMGDPTSRDEADLVDTDGGFLRLDGAYNITRLINIGDRLLVIAENGVWAITGGDSGFTALDYTVVKISDHGSVAPNATVQVDNGLAYWSDDGIYFLGSDQYGELAVNNITNASIQLFYEEIPDRAKVSAQGYFDTYERKVRWLYTKWGTAGQPTFELVFDVNLSAFYKHKISNVTGASPMALCYVEVPPFSISDIIEPVVYNTQGVTYNGEQVVYVDDSSEFRGRRELLYLTQIPSSSGFKFTFSRYQDGGFRDWFTYNGVGADASAYLITGYDGAGDFQRYKQTPYITFHFQQTEDGFTEDAEGDLYPRNPSSCLVQAQWEWANSAESGRWGRQFQAYRIKRHFIPLSSEDGFDNGFNVVSTKNKLRGKGKVLSLYIQSEPEKNLRLLGWSSLTSVGTNV